MHIIENLISEHYRRAVAVLASVLVLSVFAGVQTANAAELLISTQSEYGEFHGVRYKEYTGRFAGKTARGEFNVPFEIVAPARKRKGNGRVVFEPPHFLLGTVGRDSILGAELLFERGYSYATVGFANQVGSAANGGNMLDATANDFVVAGMHVGPNAFPFPRDVEILKQFVELLKGDSVARSMLGRIRSVYAYGISQSAEALYELAYGPGAAGLFDLTVLHVPLWRPAFARPDTLAALPEHFEPLPDIGKVMIVSAEGDLLISQSMQFRQATSSPNYRLYEIAGAPHLAEDVVVDEVRTNPLDVSPVVRAAFVAGDRWVRWRRPPPKSRLLATSDQIDPIYLVPTGISRDANGNAVGGVRFPDVEIGRARHIASLPGVEVIPGLPGLIGAWFDLRCVPAHDSITGEPRFTSHSQYLHGVWQQAFRLFWDGYLLPRDALALYHAADTSDVGKPNSCEAGVP